MPCAPACDERSLPTTTAARRATVQRDTKETRIRVAVDLDGIGTAKLATGIGFFDHMLEQIARHGLIDLEIEAQGDLHIDGHHTVEDVGITLARRSARRGRQARPGPLRPRLRAARRGAVTGGDRFLRPPQLDDERAVQVRNDRRLRRPAGARVLPGLRQPCARDRTSTTCAARTRTTSARPCSRPLPALRTAITIDPRVGDAVPSTKGSL